MIFKTNKHNNSLYNTLLLLSRNIFFYKNIGLRDIFETRIYLMFIHFSILLIIFKKKKSNFDQKKYDSLFNNIEYNLRELGFGDVSVNKKMKDLNKILYDILLKLEKESKQNFEINEKLIFKYFDEFKNKNNDKYKVFRDYFLNYYNFCFELPLNNMIRDSLKFNYGSS